MSDGGGDSGYSDADDVTGDTVLEQSETTFSDDGLVLSTLTRVRFHDASGTGALGSPSSGIGARVSYSGSYYDTYSGRTTATVDVGTNAGSAWSRPGSVPGRSDTVLVTIDAVTTLGSGVDGSVRRVEYAYDGRGNAYLVTSYDAASGGNVVNQVQREFNGLGQMTKEWQAHAGAVNTSTSPKVQYAYSEMPNGANHSRLTSMTYPNGRVITFDYGTAAGLNDTIGRLAAVKDGSTTLESYSYLGAGGVVVLRTRNRVWT